jgi:hypothetical protein
MKVAFATDRDPLAVHTWSGWLFHVYRHCLLKLIKKLVYLSMGANYHWYRDRLVVSSFGAQLERRLGEYPS